MSDDENHGRIFERLVLNKLRRLKGVDAIWDENDLRKEYGWQSVGVDFLIEKGDSIIAIQTKYKKTRRREDHAIHNFIKSVDYIVQVTKKKLHLGLWISRIKPFNDNVCFLSSRNIACVHDFDDMEYLADEAYSYVEKAFLELC